MSNDDIGCLPFILGMLVGTCCLFPRGCDYQEPTLRYVGDLNNDTIPDAVVVDRSQSRHKLIPYIGTKEGRFISVDDYLVGLTEKTMEEREAERKYIESRLLSVQ